ncbi:MAG: imidazoleglycerol-phosphate dehydratase HisB [Ruminococcaceae bacterium]|nr:imidazoleglycerol-phosphate dehydratase HisB [Oscillospiraceae bacterium]
MRTAEIKRKTGETDIVLTLNVDGRGKSDIQTGCGFLDHMLTLFSRHGRFDLTIRCEGDTWVDDHHTVEDVGIALGDAFRAALGEKKGINRYGSKIIPMDESLVLAAVDFSGRSHLGYALEVPTEKVGSFDTELVEEFLLGFTRRAECTLHVRKLCGTNSHHIIEGGFKAMGRAFREAVAIDDEFADEIPSTKGVL